MEKRKLFKMVVSLLIVFSLLQINSYKIYATNDGNSLAYQAEVHIGKPGSYFGLSSDWCARFVWKMAEWGGIPSGVIPHTDRSTDMYNKVINSGGKVVATPLRGDLVFYRASSGFCHVAIVVDSQNSVHGNVDTVVRKIPHNYYRTKDTNGNYYCPEYVFVRPNYNTKPGKPTLKVTAGNSITNTSFSWNATSNTHHYDLRIYNNAGTTILYKQYLTSTSFSYALSAGNYSADVASVGSDNNNYTFSSRVSFTVNVKPGKPTLKVAPGTNSYKTTFSWDKTSNTHHYDVRIYNASTKKEYKSVYNLTGNSYSITLPVGKYYANVASVVKDCSSYTFSSDVNFTVDKEPTKSSDGWYYVDKLPTYVNSSKYTIQYNNTTEKIAKSSPGSNYKKGALAKSQYENSGSPYWSKIELPTSNTRVLVNYNYYHFCGGSTGVYANYELSGKYVHEDTITNVSSVYVDSSGPDSDNPNYKYYKLRWNNGSLAYCHSGTTCDGTYGSHGNRSYIWYKNSQYQNKVKVDYYKYTKQSGWVSSKDSSATSVKYRYKLKSTTKPSYTATVKAYSGTYDGKSHTISISGVKSGSTIKYRTSNTGTWTTTKPTRTSAGTTTVYYQITNPNYSTITGSQKITIAKRNVSTLTYSKLSNKTYTGKQIKYAPTVKYGSKTLKSGTDYTLSYGTNKSTGKATVKITGKGNYTGSITKTFYIVPKAPSSLKVSAGKKSVKVSYNKSTGASGYQIAYSTSKNSGYKYVTTTSLSKTISKLTSKKTYYIKVRTYKTVGKTKYYGSYTSIKSIKAK